MGYITYIQFIQRVRGQILVAKEFEKVQQSFRYNCFQSGVKNKMADILICVKIEGEPSRQFLVRYMLILLTILFSTSISIYCL
jgi:hypothetical protein